MRHKRKTEHHGHGGLTDAESAFVRKAKHDDHADVIGQNDAEAEAEPFRKGKP